MAVPQPLRAAAWAFPMPFELLSAQAVEITYDGVSVGSAEHFSVRLEQTIKSVGSLSERHGSPCSTKL